MLQAQLRNGQVPRPPDGASSPAYLPSKAYLDFDAESQREDNEDHDGLWEYENATCLEGCWERRVVRWCCFFLLLMVAVGIMILVVVAAPRHPHHSRRRLFKRPIVWPDS
jgi:hypothetical protein